jgi:NIMA (never in mitosis gene a)-related kinase 1/4/5
MCPEILTDIPYGYKSDIWSLGELPILKLLCTPILWCMKKFNICEKKPGSPLLPSSGCCMFEILAHRPAFKATVSVNTTQLKDALLSCLHT